MRIQTFFALTLAFLSCTPAVVGQNTLGERVEAAIRQLDSAESRFVPASAETFHRTREALRQEVQRVETQFSLMSAEEAQAWKTHLRWELLTKNLHQLPVNPEEMKLVRRWMYSNRPGLEEARFAELRRRMDEHLDQIVTFSYLDLQSEFRTRVAGLREQLHVAAEHPGDVTATAIGRTLGWLEQTGQLDSEVEEIRRLLSQPNAQITVSEAFASRVLKMFATSIEQTIPVSDVTQAPATGLLRRERTLNVSGSADTVGSTRLDVVPHSEHAEVKLIFEGQVDANCTADAGPARLDVRTQGTVRATKPIQFSTTGWELGQTVLDPNARVTTNLGTIAANRRIILGVAHRQANRPQSMQHMRNSARTQTDELVIRHMDQQVDVAVQDIRREIAKTRSSLTGFSDVTAPLIREGAAPRLRNFQSTDDEIQINVDAGRRDHFGALVPFDDTGFQGDIQLRVHLSFLNNSLETILGGKTLSDEFLMKYAKILQPQLPIPLMVHSRSTRWSITTRKARPLELTMLADSRLQLTMRLTEVMVDGETSAQEIEVVSIYDIEKNAFDEYELVRDGEVQLSNGLREDQQAFLTKRMDAFFAPVLNGSGVAVPDGGALGRINQLELEDVRFANDWLAIGVSVPQSMIDSFGERLEQSESVAADKVADASAAQERSHSVLNK